MAYFPNGTSVAILEKQCSDCQISDDSPCPILFAQMNFNSEQLDNPGIANILNELVSKEGICLMKPLIDDIRW